MDDDPVDDDEDSEDKKALEAEHKLAEDFKDKLKAMTETEIKSIYKLYAENFL